MKKLLILVLVVLSALVGCDKKEVKNAPLEKLSFVVEEDPYYIGSYFITRVNLGEKWVETGEWTPLESLVGREIVCFGYFGGSGTFRARSDHQWKQVEFDNRTVKCLELVKKK